MKAVPSPRPPKGTRSDAVATAQASRSTPVGGLGRLNRLDALRGLALLWMAFFHFSFDLSHEGLITANFYRDALWTTQRTAILSLFLLCAGAGQAVAVAQGQSRARFVRRWLQVAGCAAWVSVGSALMFPASFIYFGVLHGMAVMLVVARVTAGWGRWLWLAGALAVLLPQAFTHPVFDTAWLDWSGLMTRKPITEDHVPLLPWMGVMWWGVAGTQWLLAHRLPWLQGASPVPSLPLWRRPVDALSWLGRWSLTFYMVHQPVLLGALSLYLFLEPHP